MSFLLDSEYMILMNSNADIGGYGLPFISMDANQLKRVKDETGITVAEEQIYWHDIEKTRGQYDWRLPDKQVKRVQDAGMRLILCAPITIPHHLPDDWFWKDERGNIVRHGLSFWNAEAQDYQREFIKKVIERYSGPDTSVIFHGFLGGESVMHNHPAFFDNAAIANFKQRYGSHAMPVVGGAPFPLSPETREWLRDVVVNHHLFMQEAFRHQFNEVWDDLQPLIATQSEANGNFAQYDIHAAYSKTWPDVEQWMLMYTYFGNGPDSIAEVRRIVHDHNCKVIVEANYCEGLRDTPHTYDLAIEEGFRGQIVCPLHPFRAHKIIEPWMYEVIKSANDAWKAAHM
jgi:hypothetical protein